MLVHERHPRLQLREHGGATNEAGARAHLGASDDVRGGVVRRGGALQQRRLLAAQHGRRRGAVAGRGPHVAADPDGRGAGAGVHHRPGGRVAAGRSDDCDAAHHYFVLLQQEGDPEAHERG